MGKLIRKAFWRGVISYACTTSLLQDLIGKEGYIQRVQEHWVDSSITIPVAVCVLVWCLIMPFGQEGGGK